MITEYLQADGHSTTTAAHGREALDRFKTDCIDLVITDQSMPEMNGVQLAAALRERAPNLPIILLTGFGEEMQALGDHPENVDLVIGKPVSASELRRAIYKAVASARDASPVLELGPNPLPALKPPFREERWCSREESNLHGFPHTVLSRTRLPFRHVSKY